MFNRDCNERSIYTSFPPKKEVQAKLEKKTIPTLTVSAHAECRFSVDRRLLSIGHSESIISRNKKVYSWNSDDCFTYDLLFHYKINYFIDGRKFDLLDKLEVFQSTNLLDLKKFVKETPTERYEKILTDLIKREIPKALEEEERESFLDEIQNMESIIFDFTFEMEDSSC